MDINIDPERVLNEMTTRLAALTLENIKMAVAITQLQEELAAFQAGANGKVGASDLQRLGSGHEPPD